MLFNANTQADDDFGVYQHAARETFQLAQVALLLGLCSSTKRSVPPESGGSTARVPWAAAGHCAYSCVDQPLLRRQPEHLDGIGARVNGGALAHGLTQHPEQTPRSASRTQDAAEPAPALNPARAGFSFGQRSCTASTMRSCIMSTSCLICSAPPRSDASDAACHGRSNQQIRCDTEVLRLRSSRAAEQCRDRPGKPRT